MKSLVVPRKLEKNKYQQISQKWTKMISKAKKAFQIWQTVQVDFTIEGFHVCNIIMRPTLVNISQQKRVGSDSIGIEN